MKKFSILVSTLQPLKPSPLMPHFLFFCIKFGQLLFQPFTSLTFLNLTVSSLALQSSSLVFLIFCNTFPNQSQFQAFSIFLHLATFLVATTIGEPSALQAHAVEITPLHSRSVSHITSKQNGFLFQLWVSPLESRERRIGR